MSQLLLEGKSDSKGLVGAETSYLGIAEDRWGGGRDQGPRGLVGAGDKRVNFTAFSSGDRVGKYLGTYSDLGLADDRGRVWAVTIDQ